MDAHVASIEWPVAFSLHAFVHVGQFAFGELIEGCRIGDVAVLLLINQLEYAVEVAKLFLFLGGAAKELEGGVRDACEVESCDFEGSGLGRVTLLCSSCRPFRFSTRITKQLYYETGSSSLHYRLSSISRWRARLRGRVGRRRGWEKERLGDEGRIVRVRRPNKRVNKGNKELQAGGIVCGLEITQLLAGIPGKGVNKKQISSQLKWACWSCSSRSTLSIACFTISRILPTSSPSAHCASSSRSSRFSRASMTSRKQLQ